MVTFLRGDLASSYKQYLTFLQCLSRSNIVTSVNNNDESIPLLLHTSTHLNVYTYDGTLIVEPLNIYSFVVSLKNDVSKLPSLSLDFFFREGMLETLQK